MAAPDAGIYAVGEVFSLLMIDEEWSVKSDRGFIWWGQYQAQRVWAEPPIEDNGFQISRVWVSTDLLRSFSPTPPALEALLTLCRSGSTSGPHLVLDAAQRLRWSACFITNDSIRSWGAKTLAAIAATQVSEAHFAAPWLASHCGATIDYSAHPVSGRRRDYDDMLNGLTTVRHLQRNDSTPERLRTELRNARGAFDEPGFEPVDTPTADSIAAHWPIAMCEDGLAYARISAEVHADHPAYGPGVAISLALPRAVMQFLPESNPWLELTALEFASPVPARGGGAWVPWADALTHLIYHPAMILDPGATATLLAYERARAMWMTATLFNQSPRDLVFAAMRSGVRRLVPSGDSPAPSATLEPPPYLLSSVGSLLSNQQHHDAPQVWDSDALSEKRSIIDVTEDLNSPSLPESVRVRLLITRADLLLESGNAAAALDDLRELRQHDIGALQWAQIMVLEGEALAQRGDDLAAIGRFSAVHQRVTMSPEARAVARQRHATVYKRLGYHEHACDMLTLALEEDELPLALVDSLLESRKAVHLSAGRLDQVVADCMRILELRDVPAIRKYVVYLEMTLAEAGRVDLLEVISRPLALAERADLPPRTRDALRVLLATSGAGAGAASSAITLLTPIAHGHDKELPGFLRSYCALMLGQLLEGQGDLEEALEEYRSVYRNDAAAGRERYEALNRSAQILLTGGRHAEAAALFGSASTLEGVPRSVQASALYDRAVSLTMSNNPAEAFALYCEVIAEGEAPRRVIASALLSRAALRLMMDDPDGAEADCEAALAMREILPEEAVRGESLQREVRSYRNRGLDGSPGRN